MRMPLILAASALFAFATGCKGPHVVHPSTAPPHTAPGQIQKQTGYNPASGKYHPKHRHPKLPEPWWKD